MLIRLFISCSLVALGVASPWLVRDWLDVHADRERAGQLYAAVTSLPARVQSTLSGRSSGMELASNNSELGVSGMREPSVASKTAMLIQGLIPGSIASGNSTKIPLFSSTALPGTPRSIHITTEMRPRVQGKLERLGLQLGDPVFVRLFKEEGELEVWMQAEGNKNYTLFRVYRLSDVVGKPGPKIREGDGQAPEGFYYVPGSRLRPDSRHHLAFDIGYPNDFDRHHGRTGKDLLVHGGSKAFGAFSLPTESMEEVYTLVEAALANGQRFFRVNSFPFRMTDARMEVEWKRDSKWIDFWVNLKEGYDFFENAHFPPDVRVEQGDYAFRLY